MLNVCVKPRLEQRRERRFVPPRRTVCRLSRAMVGCGPWSATVRNISAEGIGLLINRPLKAGMLLTVEFPGTNEKPGVLKTIKVAHAAAQAGGSWWVVGARFACKLNDAELRTLM